MSEPFTFESICFDLPRVIVHKIMAYYTDRGHLCATSAYRLDRAIDGQIEERRYGYEFFVRRLGESGLLRKIVVDGNFAGTHLGGLLSLAVPDECGDQYPAEWVAPIGLTVSSFAPPLVLCPNIIPPIAVIMEIS